MRSTRAPTRDRDIRRCFTAKALTASEERPRGHLEGFGGYLHADAFAGYAALCRPKGNKPPRITHVACIAHARRKFFEVFETTKSPIAEQAMRQIQAPSATRSGRLWSRI